MKYLFSLFWLVIISNSFAQNSLTPARKLAINEKIESKNLLDKSIGYDLSFVFFVTTSDIDSSTLYKFIREKELQSYQKEINFFVFLFENEGTLGNPSFDGKKIQGNECYLLCKEDLFGKSLQTIYRRETEISIDFVSLKKNYASYQISNKGNCSRSHWDKFNPIIAEIIKLFYENLYSLKSRNFLNTKIDSIQKIQKDEITQINKKFLSMDEQLTPNHYLSLSVNYNFGSKQNQLLNTSTQNYKTQMTAKSGFGLGLDYHFVIKSTHEIATGIHFINYNVLLSADSVQFNYSQTDKDGEKYQRRIYGFNLKEEANINFFNVPLYYTFNYKLNEKAKVYVKAGLQFIYIYNATYAATDGEFSYRGKYNGIKDEFENISDYGFYEKQQVNKNTHNLDVKKFNTYCFVGSGFKYEIDKKTDFTIGMNVNIAGSNLLKQKTDSYITSQTANDYNSLLYSFDKFKINPISFEFGLVSKF